MVAIAKNYTDRFPSRVAKNLSRYLEKSKDTAEEYLQSKSPEHMYAPQYSSGWADFDVYDDIMWIRTAFSKNREETKKGWEELKEIARSMNCKKIQFTTRRDGKIWERLFDDMKIVQWKIEVKL
jgi:hypothetical protein